MNRENGQKRRESRRKKHPGGKAPARRLCGLLIHALAREIHPPRRDHDFDLELSRGKRGLR